MKKIRPNKNIWYNWSIESKRKSVSGFIKDKCISLFKTNTPKQTVYGWGQKLSKPKTQSKIRILFILRMKKKKLKNNWRYLDTFWNKRRKRKKGIREKWKLMID